MCTFCDAAPKGLEEEQDVIPAGLLPLRAQLGVATLAGFLGGLGGALSKSSLESTDLIGTWFGCILHGFSYSFY